MVCETDHRATGNWTSCARRTRTVRSRWPLAGSVRSVAWRDAWWPTCVHWLSSTVSRRRFDSNGWSGVNLIKILRTNFSYKCQFSSFSLVTFLVKFCFGKKFAQKLELIMLMKWMASVNFINILRAAFVHVNPKSTKRQKSCQSFWHFWDLRSQKLLGEHWWNEPQVSISPTFYE